MPPHVTGDTQVHGALITLLAHLGCAAGLYVAVVPSQVPTWEQVGRWGGDDFSRVCLRPAHSQRSAALLLEATLFGMASAFIVRGISRYLSSPHTRPGGFSLSGSNQGFRCGGRIGSPTVTEACSYAAGSDLAPSGTRLCRAGGARQPRAPTLHAGDGTARSSCRAGQRGRWTRPAIGACAHARRQ